MSTDEIIDAVGGMGKFQIYVMVVLLGPRLLTGWSMLKMSFGGAVPDSYWCESESNKFLPNSTGTEAVRICPASNETDCTFKYSEEKNTVVNEWDLVCDQSTISSVIISIQMGGVLVGCLLSGQSSELIGRKKTYIVSVFIHGCVNLAAAFSTSWEMFTAFRFFTGAMIGAVLTISFPYCMEFIGQEWRPITALLPFWSTGTALLALCAWLLPDWSYLQIIIAAIHVPFFIALLFVPDSLRWLTVHGHLKKAEAVVDRMARYNGTEKPANTSAILKKISDEEEKLRASGQKYTYLDIYRPWSNFWKSAVFQFVWMCLSFVFYGIAFGVGNLNGNLYLNMFLLTIIEIPGFFAVYYLNNRIGRKKTCFAGFSIGCVAAFSVAIVSRFMTAESGSGPAITGLALTCRLGVAAAWNGYAVLTSENYPTTIRNLGYGAANTAARVGSIVSPYIFAIGGGELLIPFIIVGSLMGVCGLSCLLMKETKGCPLEDTAAGQTTTPQEDVKVTDIKVEMTEKSP